MDISLGHTVLLVGFIFLAGFVDSIAGGGGIISLPAYFAAGLPPHIALATNKFSGFIGTSTAVLRYYRAGKIHLRIGLLAALGALIGSAIGAKIALLVSETAIRSVMLVMVPVVLAVFLLKDRIFPPSESDGAAKLQGLKSVVIGAGIGCYDGFFGPGTGTFLAIAFYFFLRLDLVTASANARLTNLASNAGSLAVFLYHGKVLFPLAFFTALAGIAGNILGSELAIANGERIVRPLTVVVLILLLGEVIRQQFF